MRLTEEQAANAFDAINSTLWGYRFWRYAHGDLSSDPDAWDAMRKDVINALMAEDLDATPLQSETSGEQN